MPDKESASGIAVTLLDSGVVYELEDGVRAAWHNPDTQKAVVLACMDEKVIRPLIDEISRQYDSPLNKVPLHIHIEGREDMSGAYTYGIPNHAVHIGLHHIVNGGLAKGGYEKTTSSTLFNAAVPEGEDPEDPELPDHESMMAMMYVPYPEPAYDIASPDPGAIIPIYALAVAGIVGMLRKVNKKVIVDISRYSDRAQVAVLSAIIATPFIGVTVAASVGWLPAP